MEVVRVKRELLNIISRLLTFIVLITVGVTTIVSQVTPARASTTYHSSCYHTVCHNPSSAIDISADCLECTGASGNPPDAYVSFIVRSQDPKVALTSLYVHSTAGSFSIGKSQLSNCSYEKTCHFRFKGNPETADLYGSSGITSTPSPTPKPTPKPTPSPTSKPIQKPPRAQLPSLLRYKLVRLQLSRNLKLLTLLQVSRHRESLCLRNL